MCLITQASGSTSQSFCTSCLKSLRKHALQSCGFLKQYREAKVHMSWVMHRESQAQPATHRDLHSRERAENAAKTHTGKGTCMNQKSLQAGQNVISNLLHMRHHHLK